MTDIEKMIARTRLEYDPKVADEIERLRNEVAHLEFCLRSRDEFIGDRETMDGLKTLPQGKAGVPGGWSETSASVEQKGSSSAD